MELDRYEIKRELRTEQETEWISSKSIIMRGLFELLVLA